MKINIITPDSTIFEGEIKDAKLIGLDGHFELLDNHAPIVSALAKGDIELVDMQNKVHKFAINGGLLEMSDNNIFKEEEIIWAKLEDTPWWPSIILSKNGGLGSKEEIYSIILLGSNTRANLTKSNISKFEKNYKQNSKIKEKDLINIIKQAKDINDIKDLEEKNKKIKEIISKLKSEGKDNINESSSETSKTKEKSGIQIKKKLKKTEIKLENDLIYKICNFLRHLTASLVRKENNYNFEKNKEYIIKMFKFIREYKIKEPIEFLKKTSLGKYIKYINEYVSNEEIKEESAQAYQSLENQVIVYLSKQK